MTLYSQIELKKAHDQCLHNKNTLQQSKLCGCFCCVTIFIPADICIWLEEDRCSHNSITSEQATAICPSCGVDSVIGDASGLPITESFLQAMHEQYFEAGHELVMPSNGNLETLAQSFRQIFETAFERHSG
jgi:hypothetical protein